ncbi:MAG: dual specificity protein phosphatase family protein [Planctomycetota bacterium]
MTSFQIPESAPPLPRSYWVVDRMFLAGAYAGRAEPRAHKERLSGLFNAGARTFVSLMEEDETNNDGIPFVPYEGLLQQIASEANEQVDCVRFPIVDRHIATNAKMRDILDTIDRSIENNRPVYVHCFGGIGRTGTVVCCWLLRHGHASRDNVFEVLTELRRADTERAWRDAPENNTQRQFVLNWPEGRAQRRTPRLSTAVLRDDWFTKLTGFSERSPVEVRDCISVREGRLTSQVNGTSYQCGRLEIVSLGELRKRVAEMGGQAGKLTISEHVGDVKALHADVGNAGSVFQVASQFNLLEMVSPRVTPEHGIGIYENDPTQGPACAIACGAGTIYRNYFVELNGKIGQSEANQVDCLADIGNALGNNANRLWKMRNGYALPSADGLKEVNARLQGMSEPELDAIREKLQIGVQWDTQVTLKGGKHLVTQVYCSALPVAYSELASSQWETFARLVLEAAYEATLAVAALNAANTGNKTVYLTLLGGGAFGNDPTWILDAVRRAAILSKEIGLEVKIVCFRHSNPAVRKLCEDIS